MIVASDLNGTLTNGSPILAVVEWIKAHQPTRYPWMYKYRILFSYLRVRFGSMELDKWADVYMREVLTLIHGADYDLIGLIMYHVVETELWPKRCPKAIALLRDYHRQGAEIIVVSAAYEPAVDLFSKKIGDLRTIGIGTPVFLSETGITLADTLTVGEEKTRRVNEIIGDRPLNVALGDTVSDLPLLEQAQQPIAVFPDNDLRNEALARGWEILE
jgi:phosphoserine phosphatase